MSPLPHRRIWRSCSNSFSKGSMFWNMKITSITIFSIHPTITKRRSFISWASIERNNIVKSFSTFNRMNQHVSVSVNYWSLMKQQRSRCLWSNKCWRGLIIWYFSRRRSMAMKEPVDRCHWNCSNNCDNRVPCWVRQRRQQPTIVRWVSWNWTSLFDMVWTIRSNRGWTSFSVWIVAKIHQHRSNTLIPRVFSCLPVHCSSLAKRLVVLVHRWNRVHCTESIVIPCFRTTKRQRSSYDVWCISSFHRTTRTLPTICKCYRTHPDTISSVWLDLFPMTTNCRKYSVRSKCVTKVTCPRIVWLDIWHTVNEDQEIWSHGPSLKPIKITHLAKWPELEWCA